MGTSRGRSVAFIVFLAAMLAAPAARADDEPPGQKQRREKALADLDAEVGKLVALVKDVDKMAPCGTATPPAAKPPAGNKKRDRGHIIGAALGRGGGSGGGQFCPDKFAPTKQKLIDLIGVVSSNSGSDKRAGAVISFWPQYVQSFDTHLKDLAQLKANHHGPEQVGKDCKATSDAMVARAKAAAANKSLDEFDDARTKAGQDSTPVLRWISAQESMAGSMDQWRNNVLLFEPNREYDKAWKPVFQAMHASSEKMFADWTGYWKAAAKECAEPAKGENHAEHKAIEDQLYQTLKTDLEDELKTWIEDTKQVYRYDCDSMKKLHESYYMNLDADGEEPELMPDYEKQAKEMKEEMVAKAAVRRTLLDDFGTRSNRLEAARNGRMGSVEKYHAWQEEMKAYRVLVKKEKDTLDKILRRGVASAAVGSRNPKIQLWMEFGKQQHKVMEKDPKYACRLADEEFCAERDDDGKECLRWNRPDCISVDQCKIWEFKPPGDKAKARGDKQVQRYKTMVEKHYNFALNLYRKNALNFTPVGGVDVLHDLGEHCANGGDGPIELSIEVAQYKRTGPDIEYVCGPEGNDDD